jgi:hypothetical protein
MKAARPPKEARDAFWPCAMTPEYPWRDPRGS